MIRLCDALAVACVLGACAAPRGHECAAGEHAALVDTLYFGTSRPHGRVSESEWSEFLATVVTPRFPDGLTVMPAQGQWRGHEGTILREQSYVLSLVHADDDVSSTAIGEIMGAYRMRFEQESVLRTTTRTCASF